jgi:hypothetical protein
MRRLNLYPGLIGAPIRKEKAWQPTWIEFHTSQFGSFRKYGVFTCC